MKTVDQARADLDYIRHTLEEAGTFTTISGIGVALAGVVGLAATAVSFWLLAPSSAVWSRALCARFLLIWGLAAATAVPLFVVFSYRKARRWKLPLHRGPSRRALRCMAPGWIAAIVLTLALVRAQAYAFIPAAWLLLDGLALLGAATFSIPPVRWMGWTLLGLGLAVCFFTTPVAAIVALSAGFGVLHLVSGMYIERSERG